MVNFDVNKHTIIGNRLYLGTNDAAELKKGNEQFRGAGVRCYSTMVGIIASVFGIAKKLIINDGHGQTKSVYVNTNSLRSYVVRRAVAVAGDDTLKEKISEKSNQQRTVTEVLYAGAFAESQKGKNIFFAKMHDIYTNIYGLFGKQKPTFDQGDLNIDTIKQKVEEETRTIGIETTFEFSYEKFSAAAEPKNIGTFINNVNHSLKKIGQEPLLVGGEEMIKVLDNLKKRNPDLTEAVDKFKADQKKRKDCLEVLKDFCTALKEDLIYLRTKEQTYMNKPTLNDTDIHNKRSQARLDHLFNLASKTFSASLNDVNKSTPQILEEFERSTGQVFALSQFKTSPFDNAEPDKQRLREAIDQIGKILK